MKILFFLRYAINGLKRGGQRVIIATLAVAFGVMSLIAMADIANAIERTLNTSPRVKFGGDLRLTSSDALSLETLDLLENEGVIDTYSQVEMRYYLLMRTEESGRANFVQYSVGIDPASYPLEGDFVINAAESTPLADLLLNPGDVLVTRDLAQQYNLATSDVLRLATPDGIPLSADFIVRGIVTDNPEHTGSRIYFNLATSEQLSVDYPPETGYISVRTSNLDEAVLALEAQGWQVARLPEDALEASPSSSLFDLMLRAAGILGLIVGGIGIANTMQVLLAKRRQEVGILKTLGYSQEDLMFIFILEAGIIGLIGSLIGVALALLAGQGLVSLFANITTLLVTWQFNFPLMLMSLLTGVLTTIIFSFYAILQTSGIRPAVIFRRTHHAGANWRDWLKAAGFYGLLSIPFALVTGIFLGSIVEGFGVVIFAIIGFVVLGIVFRLILWIVLRILPGWGSHLLRIARNNMRKRASSMLFAMIALFVGIYTLGFSLTIVQVGMDEQSERQSTDDTGYNLLVYANPDDALQIEQFIETEANNALVDFRYLVTDTEIGANSQVFGTVVEFRDSAWDITITEGVEFGTDDGIYVPEWSPLLSGDEVSIVTDAGTVVLPVIGRYTPQSFMLAGIIDAPIISLQTAQASGLEASGINVFAMLSPEIENDLAQEIGQSFPQVMTLTRSDIIREINGLFLNLLGFALAMAGLALLAAIMLIANVVSLSMLERIFEIGVMKAIGYSRQDLVILLALENSLIGLIASILALIGVQITIILIILTQEAAVGVLFMKPTTVLAIIIAAIVLTMGTAIITAWQSLQTRPAIVLNQAAT